MKLNLFSRSARFNLITPLSIALATMTGCQTGINRQSITQVTLGLVSPLYSAGPQWNDFVSASNKSTSCLGTETDCIHGGELKSVVVSGVASCTGLTLTDALQAFDWSCNSSSGSVIFTSAIKDTKNLADLIDPAVPAWRSNSVSVSLNGVTQSTTPNSQWWTNPVAPLPDATSASVVLNTPGTVYVAMASATILGYNVNADKVSIVIPTGVKLTGTAANNYNGTNAKATPVSSSALFSIGSQKFISIEGQTQWAFGNLSATYFNLDGNALSHRIVGLTGTAYVRLNQLNLRAITEYAILASNNLGLSLKRLNLTLGGFGIALNISSYAQFRQINVYANVNQGMDMSSVTYSAIKDLYGDATGNCASCNVYWIGGTSSNNSYEHIEVHNASATSFRSIENNSTFKNIIASGGSPGVKIGGTGSTVQDVYTYSNTGTGLEVPGNGIRFTNVVAVNNGLGGVATASMGINETTVSGVGNAYKHLVLANNVGAGLSINVPNAVAVDVMSVSNGGDGIKVANTGAKLSQITVASNAGNGINQSIANGAGTYHEVLALNNSLNGINIGAADTTGTTLSQIASGYNTQYGIYTTDAGTGVQAKVKLVGKLLTASNTSGACFIPPNGITGILNSGCTGTGPSSVTLLSLGSLSSLYQGALAATDSANSSNTLGASPFTSVTDWSHYAYSSRAWGKDTAAQGRCSAGTCRINDYGLIAGSSLQNTSGIFGSQNESFITGGNCPSAISGDQTASDYSNAVTFLTSAVEDMNAVGGNKNGLCEAGESCIYLPNFGADPGEGALSSCYYRQNSGLVGISIQGYVQNGH